MSKASDNIIIRELSSFDEYKASEQFQRDVWGEDDPADNADLMQAIAHSGGLVAAAFQHECMIGFVFAFPTKDPRVQHSHRLAVLPQKQGLGLGTRLKWFQREWAMQRGIDTIHWTYDPLRRANATLNITKLGAVASEYHEDYYGNMAGINAGIPSDRIVAHWSLHSARVNGCANNDKQSGITDSTAKHIAIPSDLETLLQSDSALALAERIRVRKALQDAFNTGYNITGFEPDACRYVLTKG